MKLFVLILCIAIGIAEIYGAFPPAPGRLPSRKRRDASSGLGALGDKLSMVKPMLHKYDIPNKFKHSKVVKPLLDKYDIPNKLGKLFPNLPKLL